MPGQLKGTPANVPASSEFAAFYARLASAASSCGASEALSVPAADKLLIASVAGPLSFPAHRRLQLWGAHMAYAVSALLAKMSGQTHHVLWVLDADNADEAEAQAMAAALRAGALVSLLVKPVDSARSPALTA